MSQYSQLGESNAGDEFMIPPSPTASATSFMQEPLDFSFPTSPGAGGENVPVHGRRVGVSSSASANEDIMDPLSKLAHQKAVAAMMVAECKLSSAREELTFSRTKLREVLTMSVMAKKEVELNEAYLQKAQDVADSTRNTVVNMEVISRPEEEEAPPDAMSKGEILRDPMLNPDISIQARLSSLKQWENSLRSRHNGLFGAGANTNIHAEEHTMNSPAIPCMSANPTS